MKETKFIQDSKEKWSEFEKAYKSSQADPSNLAKRYLDITEDLGYAQTHYNRRTVRVYLNQLAQKVFLGVHKGGADSWRKIVDVFVVSIPIEFFKARKALFSAFVFFVLYMILGAVTTHFDPEFPRTILQDSYVDMTLQNIEMGNPLAVYQSEDTSSMFVGITTNNLRVALMTFFFGFFATIGTHILLFSNGVMLGSFQYFFKMRGLLVTSFLGIWIHGAFEISAIVLSGAAGITAGNGILFPGGFSRLHAFRLSTMRGLKMMIGILPFIVFAGLLESYVTRNYQDLSEWAKWGIILFSFACIIFYFVIYPIFVARRYPNRVQKADDNLMEREPEVELYVVRQESEILQKGFTLFFQKVGKVFRISFQLLFPIALVIAIFQGMLHADKMYGEHYFDWFAHGQIVFGLGLFHLLDVAVGILWWMIFTLIICAVVWSIKEKTNPFSYRSYFAFLKKKYFPTLLAFAPTYFLLFFFPIKLIYIALFFIPALILAPIRVAISDDKIGFKAAFKERGKNYISTLLSCLVFGIVVFVVAQPIAFVGSIPNYRGQPELMGDLLDMITGFIKNVTAAMLGESSIYLANIIRQVVYICFFFLVFPLLWYFLTLVVTSSIEKEEAIMLRENFKLFGKRKRHQE